MRYFGESWANLTYQFLTTYQWSKSIYLPNSQVWSLCLNYENLPDRMSRRLDVVKSDLVRNYGVNKLRSYLSLLLLSSSIGLNLNLGRIDLHWTWNYHEGERELVYYKRHYVVCNIHRWVSMRVLLNLFRYFCLK